MDGMKVFFSFLAVNSRERCARSFIAAVAYVAYSVEESNCGVFLLAFLTLFLF